MRMHDCLDQDDTVTEEADRLEQEQMNIRVIEKDLGFFLRLEPIYSRHGFTRDQALIHYCGLSTWEQLKQLETSMAANGDDDGN
jgi:hypothetical protein